MSSPSRLIIWSDVSVVLVSGRTLLEATTCAAIAFREERGCWEPSLVAGEGWGEIGMGVVTLGVIYRSYYSAVYTCMTVLCRSHPKHHKCI